MTEFCAENCNLFLLSLILFMTEKKFRVAHFQQIIISNHTLVSIAIAKKIHLFQL